MTMGLTDIYDAVSSHDVELEKAAADEFCKVAEEDAAGRIMARGFMDELNKLAAPMALPKPPPVKRTRVTIGKTRPAVQPVR
ncbi:MAG: hypothetical protein DRP42_00665 [Tenericutes bacterium]|nr:MAG: hypothetical protein DRP42_00665 [Mycoplasmatota bacterium]